MGPLLYHFADMYGQEDVSFFSSHLTLVYPLTDRLCTYHYYFQEMSVELSLEDVKRIALSYGFQFEVIF